MIAVFARAILEGIKPKIFGDGNQTRDFVYVKDLADFIVGAINKNPEHKLFNLANGEQVSVNKIFEELKNASGYKEDAEYVAAVNGEIRDICLDTKLAQKELGGKAKTPLSKGIKETFEYFKVFANCFVGFV